MNKVILLGNLTRDPELRYTPKGSPLCKFGIAHNRKWKTESGEQREEVLFVDVDVFGRTAEVIGQHFKKGRQILVEGRLKLDHWDDKQTGQKRQKLGVVLESFSFTNDSKGGGVTEPANKIRKEDVPGAEPAAEPTEDDVPF